MVFVNEKNNGALRTIDKERGIVLICTGTNREHYSSFSLFLEDTQIIFGGYGEISVADKSNKHSVSWKIVALKIPDNSGLRKDEIKNLIKEALDGYGAYSNRDVTSSVSVKFDIQFS